MVQFTKTIDFTDNLTPFLLRKVTVVDFFPTEILCAVYVI